MTLAQHIRPAPVLIKDRPDMTLPPDERLFYVLGRNGLYICRNHEFFRSCVPARRWPSELADQERFLIPSFPVIPRPLLERVVGFFARIAELHSSEAAVLLVWDREQAQVRVRVPPQIATVQSDWLGVSRPVGVRYDFPTDLAAHELVFGSIHSHVEMPAYASGIDVEDEAHFPGLHAVVGRIGQEPPEFHVEAVADEARFLVDPRVVLGGYERRCQDVPQPWIDAVEVRTQSAGWWPATAPSRDENVVTIEPEERPSGFSSEGDGR
jgi:hypothetical protein